MRRLVLIGGVVFILALVMGLVYIRSSGNSSVTSPQNIVGGNILSGSLENRVSTLEDAISLLINRVNNLSLASGKSELSEEQPSSSSADRIQSLESTVANLQVQINVLKGGSTSTTTSTKSPVYIPLGWSGSSQATDWTSITTQTIVIDPADYAGYTSMQFEANIQIYQGNGMAYARVYDKEDGLAATNSQVSTTSQDYMWVTSATFQLPSTSKKTYLLQLKSTSSYAANIQNARIKVNF